MKIFELLSGETENPMQPDVSPMAMPPTMPQNPMEPPQQTAGVMDKIGSFFTTPQPIGGTASPAPTPPPQVPGQPPAQTSGMISRPFGNTAAGQGLDALNTALTPKR